MKKILFPTDFSKHANNAFSYAVKLAEDLDASICILHVSTLSLIRLMTITSEERSDSFEENSDAAKEELASLLAQFPTSRIDELKIVNGSFIAAEIRDEAKDGKYDLVVMGMKGKHGAPERWMGSITTNLMINAPCPILAIPEKAIYSGIQKIALATELPSSKDLPKLQVSDFADALGAKLEFVTVDNIVRNIRKFQVGQEKEKYFGMEYTIITNSSIPNGLNDFVVTNNSDVLSLYIPDRKLWERLYHFRTSKGMAFHTKIPLFVFQK